MGICSSNSTEDNINYFSGVKPIVIETETWKRDSHGLFDYETTDVVRRTLKIQSKDGQTFMTNIGRDDGDIMLDMPQEMIKAAGGLTVDNVENPDGSKNIIAHILYKEGQYWIYNKPFYNKDDDFISNPENLIWYTVRDYRNSASSLGYKLKRGDILKFGRARLRIVEINLEGSESDVPDSKGYDHKDMNSDLPKGFFVTEDDIPEGPACRICFSEGDADNPLISAGKCAGSLKFIHYRCLKDWLESKRTIKHTETTISYHWKTLEGELCKTAYPELFKTQYSLVSYVKPEKNFMILESISSSPSKSIYVVNLDARNEAFRIGRGHDSDIRVSDISVSRLHAIIVKTEENELVIKDNNSKFGTLICLQHPLLLSEFDSIHLQAGRTLMEIQMKERKDWTLKSCLWVRQNNEAEPAIRTKNYLGKFGYTDSFLPDEFKVYWNLERQKALKFERTPSEDIEIYGMEKDPLYIGSQLVKSSSLKMIDDSL